MIGRWLGVRDIEIGCSRVGSPHPEPYTLNQDIKILWACRHQPFMPTEKMSCVLNTLACVHSTLTRLHTTHTSGSVLTGFAVC